MEKGYMNIFALLVVILPSITFFLSIVCSFTTYNYSILSNLEKSINDYPLLNLEFLDISCGEEKYLTNIYSWPGSYEGCSCADVNHYHYDQNNKYLVFKGKCDKNQTMNGCQNIPEKPIVPLYNWYLGHFCSKKYSKFDEENFIGNYTTLLNNSVFKNENCIKGFKKCGKLDEIGNYLCFPEDQECPINDIIISNHIRTDLIDYNYTFLGDKYIYFTNKAIDKPVITKLKVAEGKLCADSTYYYTEYPQFILDKQFEFYGCNSKLVGSLYDEKVIKLDNITKESLFEDSGLNLSASYNQSAEYPLQSLNAEMFLYSKNYIGLDKKYIKENNINVESLLNENNMHETNEKIERNLICVTVVKWLSLAAFLINLGTFGFLGLFISNEKFALWVWTLETFFTYLGMNIPAMIGFSSIRKIISVPLFFDSITNKKISSFNDHNNGYYKYSLIILIVINLQLVINLYVFLVFICKCFGGFSLVIKINKIIDINRQPSEDNSLESKNQIEKDIPKKTQNQDPFYKSSDFTYSPGINSNTLKDSLTT